MTQTQRDVAIAVTAAAIGAGALYLAGKVTAGANEDGIRVKNGSILVIAETGGFEKDGKKFKSKEKVKACLTLVRVKGECKDGDVVKDLVAGVKSFAVTDDRATAGSHEFDVDEPFLRKKTVMLTDGTGWGLEGTKPQLILRDVHVKSLTAHDKNANPLVTCSPTGDDFDVVFVPADCP